MIKMETIGMIDVAKLNPVKTSDEDTVNFSFVKEDDGSIGLIMNNIDGHYAYLEDEVIPAGEYLNEYKVNAWEGLVLVVDMKHIEDEEVEVDDVLVVSDEGKLKKGEPKAGDLSFTVESKVMLTMPAVKVRIRVAKGA